MKEERFSPEDRHSDPPMPKTEHQLSVESGFIEGGFNAHCLCGWEGPERETMGQAIDDGYQHAPI